MDSIFSFNIYEWFPSANYRILLALLPACICIQLFLVARKRTPKAADRTKATQSKTSVVDAHVIEPLADFDWKATEPKKVWRFKPTYNITMGLQSDTPSNLITVDRDYHARVNLRRTLMQDHESTVLGLVPGGAPAINELYTYLLSHYLPTRYPTMFQRLDDDSSESGPRLRNLVTARTFRTTPPSDPASALKTLGETVEEDMFLLKPTPEGHRVLAYVCCFPSGFDPSEKLDKLLVDVHGPVPAYGKIGSSMERYFGRLEAGKNVKRTNWSIQTHDALLNNNSHAGKGEYDTDEAFDVNQTFFRSELQTLSRLPQTGFILFSFKTYFYPVQDIKDDGLGPDLADAIEGLDRGNAEGMWDYKGAGHWGKPLVEYLRS